MGRHTPEPALRDLKAGPPEHQIGPLPRYYGPTESVLSPGVVDIAPGGFPLYTRSPMPTFLVAVWGVTAIASVVLITTVFIHGRRHFR